MAISIGYTDNVKPLHLDNCRSPLKEGDLEVDDTISLLDFVDLWLDTFKKNTVKKASFTRLECSRNALKDYPIGSMPIGKISFFDIQKYINELVDAGYSMSGIKKQMRIVTSPLKQAAAIRIISADPSIGVKLPVVTNLKKATKDIVAYTSDEQDRLFNEIKAHPENIGYLAVVFMIETGIRSGELLALKWEDVQIERSRMHIHATIVNPTSNIKSSYQDSPKSKSSNRVIPLTPRAIAILKMLPKGEWVFSKNGERYSYKTLMYNTKKLCRVTSVPYYGKHVFRHTFATNCYYKGIDVKILSKLMGHSSVNVTYNTYISLYGDGFDTMYAALCM